MTNVTNLVEHKKGRPSSAPEADALRTALADIGQSLYDDQSLAAAEAAIDQVADLLHMPWAWWTPDAAHPDNCAQAEQFSRSRGWPKEIMQLWRQHRIGLYSPLHIRARFENLPFVTYPDTREQHHACPVYVRFNQLIARLGITAMLHLPVHLPKGRIALVNWAGDQHPSEVRQLLPRISGELLSIGHLFMRNYAAQSGQNETIAEETARLTPREWDCIRLIAQGYREAEAGDLLAISKSTLRFHIDNVVRKFGCRNRTHAIALIAQLGLLGPIGH